MGRVGGVDFERLLVYLGIVAYLFAFWYAVYVLADWLMWIVIK